MSRLIFAASILALTIGASGPASALSASECSTKYQAAKKDGSLGATKWNDFRKAQCGADAQPAAATTTTAPAAAPTEAAKPAPTQTAAKPEPTAKPTTPAASGSAVFPSKIDPKYASESAGKQRQKTCLDQYNINKANGGNGGLNWIMKGGGYYSECNKRLKI
ncbi:hypothetical protein [Methylobacterium haplocladii]|uniref:Uncharacterized protein n=1 Tax=Methylobacterium haplocladii TaxID=1176176 RepID=A0A512IR65_9HYPH|nr:hypothetical protein [Methylobacterium haplocladii]GEP00181.1 hypothetical protein MHA02_25680 [Methylobacterium haplocladii]GJD83764.1 hypothetical protein HPGCJGGD_1635 [Methylobacterium haplocladii]GLS57973.1 hypothetical protein GCM10007887_06290 [Methylobacterium haplocladii]